MKNTSDIEQYKEKIGKEISFIDAIIRKRACHEDEFLEVFNCVMEELEKKDWSVGKFKGKNEAKFTTYLYKVIINNIIDCRRKMYGRYSPPKNKNVLLKMLMKMVYELWCTTTNLKGKVRIKREEINDLLIDQIKNNAIFKNIEDKELLITLVDQAINEITLKPCKNINIDIFYGWVEIFSKTTNELSPEFYEFISFIMESCFESDLGLQADSKLESLIMAFQDKVNLSTRERMFLKLVFIENISIQAAGREIYGYNGHQSYRKMRELINRISVALNNSGLSELCKEFLEK